MEKQNQAPVSDLDDSDLVDKIHSVEKKLEAVNSEKILLGRRFNSISAQWRQDLQLMEARYLELEATVHELQELNDQLAASNALLLDLKYQADQAEAQAVACDNEKSLFLARMSHEIRSPLAVILGYADQILEDGLDQAACRHVASQIRNTSDFILDVVNEVLDLSKIEAGAFTLAASDTLVEPLVYEVVRLFEQSAKQKGIDLDLDVRFPIPEAVFVDGHRLKQVLVNLCSNAVKFTEEGAVQVKIWYADKTLFFEVQDSGIGMSPAQLKRIFQPFTQAENSITARFGGTGLGLYIAHEIVEQMGGHLVVTSKEDQGSRFKVCIPVVHASVKLIDESGQVDSKVTKNKELVQLTGRVLVAEDTPDLQIIIGAVLKKSGLDVVLVNNGQQAVEAYQKGEFDLVLLDVEMPVLDGVSAFQAMRAWEQQVQLQQCPILALTAHAFKDQVSHLESMGFNAIVTKPFQRHQLLRTLGSWLDKKT